MGKKNITLNNLSTAIEDLARMVKEGFDEMNGIMKTRFDAVDKRFERVENRLTVVEQRLDNINLRLGQFAFNIDFQELKTKVEMMEKKCCTSK